MILECPQCSARYKVKPELIPAQGKKVKCKKCQSVFKADAAGNCSLMGGPPQPKQEPASAATVMIDSAKIQAMVQPGTIPEAPPNIKVEQQPVVPPTPKVPPAPPQPQAEERQPVTDFNFGDSSEFQNPQFGDQGFGTMRMNTVQDPTKFATQNMQVQSPQTPPPEPENNSVEDTMSSELDQFNFGLSESQAEPSTDMDFSFKEEPEPEFESNTIMADSSAFSTPTEEPLGFANIEFGSGEEPGPSSEPLAEVPTPPQPPSEPIGRSTVTELPRAPEIPDFQARIEGQVYPNLNLVTLERWIKEGRLLESDEVAQQGSSDFQRADSITAIQSIFQRYYGSSGKSSPAKTEKKGFFSKLFGK